MDLLRKYKSVISMCVIQGIILFLMLIMCFIKNTNVRLIVYFTVVLLGTGLSYSMYRIYHDIKKNVLLENKIMLAKEQDKMQEEHVLAMKESMEYYNGIRDEIIEKINKYENLEINIEEAREFTIRLLSEYESLNKIEYCSNKVIDAILYNKCLLIKSNDIKTNIDILVPEIIGIKPIDLMSVYANLLDNAIEACLKLPKEQRFIEISSYVKANYLVVKVINSKLKNISIDIEGGRSTKPEAGHGIGLQIIKNTCENNQGSLLIEDYGERIMFFASLRMEQRYK